MKQGRVTLGFGYMATLAVKVTKKKHHRSLPGADAERLPVLRPNFRPALALAGASLVSMHIYRTNQEYTAARTECERHAQFSMSHTFIQGQSEKRAYITDIVNLQSAASRY